MRRVDVLLCSIDWMIVTANVSYLVLSIDKILGKMVVRPRRLVSLFSRHRTLIVGGLFIRVEF